LCTGFGTAYATSDHDHAATVTDDTTLTYASTVVSISSVDAQPPFIKVILIGPDDANQEMPDDSVGLFSSSSIPAGFNQADGTGGTVDMSERFVLGADAGGDGGGTGGSGTHTHTSSAHTHTVFPAGSHTHAQIDYSAASATTLRTQSGRTQGVPSVHHKQVVAFASHGTLSSDSVTVDGTSFEPAFTYLYAIQNISGGALTPEGAILPFVGVTVPEGWSLCDGSNGTPDLTSTQVKVTTSPTKLGTLGGSDANHTHTTQSHGHTHGSHQHGFSLSNFAGTVVSTSAATAPVATAAHTHILSAVLTGSATPTLQSKVVVLNSSSGKPLFRTVKFIRKDKHTITLRGGKVKGGILR
jgi:hypothetical protein